MSKHKVLGIVAEYNPLHNGHIYHINEAKKITSADYTIVVMSGSFVQRGEPAIADKYSRAKCAINEGADLVIQLPIHACISSSECFADTAVSLLNHLKITDICFGAETEELPKLQRVAEFLSFESDEYKEMLTKNVSNGMSYPHARQIAVNKLLGNEYSKLLEGSNNILGIEYLKSIIKHNYDITSHLIQRKGDNYNDLQINSEYASATAIRSLIFKNKLSGNKKTDALVRGLIPESSYNMISELPCIHVSDLTCTINHKLSEIMYSCSFDKSAFVNYVASFNDCNEDIASRIYNQFSKCDFCINNCEAFFENIKTKQYTLSRIKRVILNIILDCKKSDVNPEYIRILGFNQSGRKYLNSIKKSIEIPVITKPSGYKDLLIKEAYATAVYNQLQHMHTPNITLNEFKSGIYINS